MKQIANTCNGLHVDIASSLEHLLDLCRDFLSIIRIFLQNNAGLLIDSRKRNYDLFVVTGFSPLQIRLWFEQIRSLFVLFYIFYFAPPV